MIIYKITNLVNSKILIGQTTRTLKRRWSEYQSDARNRPKRAIEHAINKYGVENFTIEVVDMCDDLDDLNKKEITCSKIDRLVNQQELDEYIKQFKFQMKDERDLKTKVKYKCVPGTLTSITFAIV